MKMRKRKHLKKVHHFKNDFWFVITPEMIARLDKFLNGMSEEFRRNLMLAKDIEGGVLAGPTK